MTELLNGATQLIKIYVIDEKVNKFKSLLS